MQYGCTPKPRRPEGAPHLAAAARQALHQRPLARCVVCPV